VDRIAKRGKGLNLTFQVRDGILSHDGEVHNQLLTPQTNKNEQFLSDYISKRKRGEEREMMPATMEGCVVRITDTIAYVGQDIEDAIRIGLIERSDIPKELREVLGSTNGEIINTLVKDVVYNSYNKSYICFSETISDQLVKLKKFNYKNIYHNKKLKKNHLKIEIAFKLLFDHYLAELKRNNLNSRIFRHFLNYKEKSYLDSTNDAEKTRDYIAGMTDRYFLEVLQEIVIPDIAL
jgi:dGTPase